MRNFTDKTFQPLFWTVAFALLTWGTFILVTGKEDSVTIPHTKSNDSVDTLPPAVVDYPVISEVSADGSIHWTLYMDRIIREQDSVMELSKPRIHYRFSSGEVLDVTGDNGSYDEKSGFLVLKGGVRGESVKSAIVFKVEGMTWDSSTNYLRTTGGVEVQREGLVFTGETLTLDLSEELASIEVDGGEEGLVVTSSLEIPENILVQD